MIYTFCFHLEQHLIRQRIKERLENEQLQTIVLDAEEMNWTRSGKEAWIDGRLFDISSQRNENGLYTLTGVFDEEETALVGLLEKKQQQSNDPGDELLGQLFELLQDIYKKPAGEQPVLFTRGNLSFVSYTSPLSSISLAIITPPPQC